MNVDQGDAVAAWMLPFLQSILVTMTFDSHPGLVCFAMKTGHMVWQRRDRFIVAEPGTPSTRVAWSIEKLLEATAG
ncbi:hypothetical protein S2M10_06640 [Sphingomonas sp. S2M10]|uniref:hypothetical protein n=1 Tax=Sphingomonas sp. S2M10 TaxID=2705010 RepID=UPI0014566E55|nr:hypothetical protein [Sphingomonas sp. S2M10]NLS25694.1 hypothetical protein [Sphingomonas sp. S2M10]